ncbi:hypothetical protein AB4254_11750 [Vibrio breoganii]
MSLFDKAKALVEGVVGEKPHLLKHYRNDFYVVDKFDIEERMQAGEECLILLKSNGCGTYNISSYSPADVTSFYFKNYEGDFGSEAVHLICTGDNEGHAKVVTMPRALEIYNGFSKEYPSGLIPRKLTLENRLCKDLGLELGTLGAPLFDGAIFPAYDAVVSVAYNGILKSLLVRADIVGFDESKLTSESRHLEGMNFSPTSISRNVEIPAEQLGELKQALEKPLYFKVESNPERAVYVDLESLSKREYQKVFKRNEKESELAV